VTLPALSTMLVGSYPQPDWLIDRARLAGRFPPRVRAKELWRIDEDHLAGAQDDATLLAIRAQERAGLDVLTDGEIRRESYSNHFATALAGIDLDTPGEALDRSGHPNPVPRIVGPIRRRRAVQVRDLKFLLDNTDRRVKITVPGPFTMAQQAQNDHYPDVAAAAMDYAAAVNEEILDLYAAGADLVQVDEPYLQARPEQAREFGAEVLDRALRGVPPHTAVHVCFGYAAIIHVRPSGYSCLPVIAATRAGAVSVETAQSNLDPAELSVLRGRKVILGVINLGDMTVETPDVVAARIRRALPHIPAEDLLIAPDCGMKYLPEPVAAAKLRAMVDGTRLVRAELAALPG
jgi:5-methyltetrahydropteroyltriglutamate--homocysteine methyltransferase